MIDNPNQAPVLTTFQRGALAVGLRKLLNSGHFNICDFEQLLKLTGRKHEVSAMDMTALHLLHCVDYGAMPPHVRNALKEKCIEALGLSEDDVIDMPSRDVPEGGTLQKFFGGCK